jgi:hypothetical protein
VSVERRNLGALFVEEIGVGGMFKQSDLQDTECYLLDGGTTVVFIWHGLDSTYHGRALCTRVCRRYLTELRRDHDLCATPQFRAIFPLPVDGGEIEIEYLESRQEPSVFISYFPKWTLRSESSETDLESAANRSPLCVSFDPTVITADETLDERYDRTGRVIDPLAVKAKTRYSDGTPTSRTHTSNVSASANAPQSHDPFFQKRSPAPSDATTTTQSFLPKVALKPVTDRQRAVTIATAATSPSTDQEQAQVPEFVAKRNALKAVKCPDPFFLEPAPPSGDESTQQDQITTAVAHPKASTPSSDSISPSPSALEISIETSPEERKGKKEVKVLANTTTPPTVREVHDQDINPGQAKCCVVM